MLLACLVQRGPDQSGGHSSPSKRVGYIRMIKDDTVALADVAGKSELPVHFGFKALVMDVVNDGNRRRFEIMG